MADTPVTTVPTTNPKQPTRAPSSTPAARGYSKQIRLDSGLKPRGNGTPPKGGKYR